MDFGSSSYLHLQTRKENEHGLPTRHISRIGLPGPAQAGVGTMTRELDSRISDGIHVRLLWDPRDGRVSVALEDTKTSDAFELPVRDGERALDVFHHPYAYAAAGRGRATQPALTSDDVSLTAHTRS
jgi:hypothetical protein